MQSIALPASASGVGGITLTSINSQQVVLVAVGTEVLAFDAATGTPVGSFSASSLAVEGFATITGVAAGGQTVVLTDAADTSAGPDGTVQPINLVQSLATGEAVASGVPYSPTRQFALAGTATGVPGTGNIYALGSAFLDTSQPNLKQAAILTITPERHPDHDALGDDEDRADRQRGFRPGGPQQRGSRATAPSRSAAGMPSSPSTSASSAARTSSNCSPRAT